MSTRPAKLRLSSGGSEHVFDGMSLEEFIATEVPSPLRRRCRDRDNKDKSSVNCNDRESTPVAQNDDDRSSGMPAGLDTQGSNSSTTVPRPEVIYIILREAFLQALATSWDAFDAKTHEPVEHDHVMQMEKFIEEYGLDMPSVYSAGDALRESRPSVYSAGDALRESSVQVQRLIMDSQGWHRMQDASEVVMERVSGAAPRFSLPISINRLYVLYMLPLSNGLCGKERSLEFLVEFFDGLERDGLVTLCRTGVDSVRTEVTEVHWSHEQLLPLSIELTAKLWR